MEKKNRQSTVVFRVLWYSEYIAPYFLTRIQASLFVRRSDKVTCVLIISIRSPAPVLFAVAHP